MLNSATQFYDVANQSDQLAELLQRLELLNAEKLISALNPASISKTEKKQFWSENGENCFFKIESKIEKLTKKSIFIVFVILASVLKSALRILSVKSVNSNFEHAVLDANGVVATLSPKLTQTPIHAR